MKGGIKNMEILNRFKKREANELSEEDNRILTNKAIEELNSVGIDLNTVDEEHQNALLYLQKLMIWNKETAEQTPEAIEISNTRKIDVLNQINLAQLAQNEGILQSLKEINEQNKQLTQVLNILVDQMIKDRNYTFPSLSDEEER